MSELAKQGATESIDAANSDRGVLVLKQTLGVDILQSFFQFFKLAEQHDSNNEVFIKAIGDCLQAIQHWIHIPDFGKFELKLSGDQIFLNEVRIRSKPRYIEKIQYLLQFFRKRRLTGFSIDQSPSQENLSFFLWGLARVKKGEILKLEAELEAKNLHTFKLGTLNWKKEGSETEAQSLATDLYNQLYEFVKTCFENFNQAIQMKRPNLDGMFDAMQMVDETDLISLFCLKSVKKADKPLPTVAVNSAFMLYAWAKSLGLPSGVFLELAGCGLAHPLALVNSVKGMPTDIRRFERSSLAMSNLHRIKSVWPLTELQTIAVLEWSIPFGKNGVYEIGGQKCYQHFFSRMLRIVVLFQQMITLDSNPAPEKAVSKLLQEEMGCDQTLVKLFVHWLGIYPVGSYVVLNSGETGQVCSTGSDLLSTKRPSVSVFKDKDGNILDTPRIIDLNELSGDNYIAGISKSLSVQEVGVPQEQLVLLSSMLSVSMSN